MTAAELESYAARLSATGLSFAHNKLDRSGNRIALVDMPWDELILRIAAMTGWRITDEGPQADEPERTKLTLMDTGPYSE